MVNNQIAVSFPNKHKLRKNHYNHCHHRHYYQAKLIPFKQKFFVLHNNCHNYNNTDDDDDERSPEVTNNKVNNRSRSNSSSISSISHSNDYDLRHSTNKKKKKKKQFPTRSNDIHSSLTAHANNDSRQKQQEQQQQHCENQFERIFDQKVHSNNQTPSSSSWYWLLTLANSKHHLQPESTSCNINEQIIKTKIMHPGQMSSCHLAISSQPKTNLQQNTLSAFVNNSHHHNHSHNNHQKTMPTMTGMLFFLFIFIVCLSLFKYIRKKYII